MKQEFKLLFAFSRIGRIRCLTFGLTITFLLGCFFLLDVFSNIYISSKLFHFISFVVFVLLCLTTFFYSIVIHVRRLHDMNLRGWWMLLSFIPFITPIMFILYYFIPGNIDENQFGKPPIKNNGWTYGILVFVLIVIMIMLITFFVTAIKFEILQHSSFIEHYHHMARLVKK